MKLFLTILFISVNSVFATNYYVSNSGNNGNSGTSSGSPFLTIAKAMSVVVNGDSILLNGGDTFNEKIKLTVGNIHFNSYGTGQAIWSGLKQVSVSSIGGNQYQATFSDAAHDLNVVVIDGLMRIKSRYPNSTYAIDAVSLTTTRLIAPHKANIGTLLAIREQNWLCDTTSFTYNAGVTNDTFNLKTALSSSTLNSYFLENGAALCDSNYEWSYVGSTFTMYLSTGAPTSVYYSTIDTLLNLHKVSGITVDNIKFTGANYIAVSKDSCRNDTIRGCTFVDNSIADYTQWTQGTAIMNNTIDSSWSNGIVNGGDTSTYIYNNIINHTGNGLGMGTSGIVSYEGIFAYSAGQGKHLCKIFNNTVKNSGYHGIRFTGQFDTVKYCFVDTAIMLKSDGAAFYTFGTTTPANADSGSAFINCIGLHTLGGKTNAGVVNGNQSSLFYVDNYANYVSVINCTGAFAMGGTTANFDYSNGNTGAIIKGNNFYDSTLIAGTTNIYFGIISGNNLGATIKGNVMYNQVSNNLSLLGANDSTEAIDSNYYIAPFSNYYLVAGATSYVLSSWRSKFSNYDIHSSATIPAGVTTYKPSLFYNATMSVSNQSLGTTVYVDVYGNRYSGTVTLQPFTSAILWPTNLPAPTAIYNVVNLKL